MPPDFKPEKPTIEFPPFACDCHAHVCGPETLYGYTAQRIYTPCDTLVTDYEHLLDVLGVARAVLVQPSFYGTDNSAMLAAMQGARRSMRAVAVVSDEINEHELAALDEAGVRGVRFNIVDVANGKGELPHGRIRAIADRIKPFGWHVEFLMHVDEYPDLDRVFSDFPVDVVFGHLGYVRTDKGVGDPGFQSLLRLLKAGRAWVKLTAPYRISTSGAPHSDTTPFAHALLAAEPARLVWGTDWPHVKAAWTIPMPKDADLADLLLEWVPDADLRKQVLVDNAARLYGFD
jgi:predicted TIM-barrel fold metal-dependent hydrolase